MQNGEKSFEGSKFDQLRQGSVPGRLCHPEFDRNWIFWVKNKHIINTIKSSY